MNEAYLLPLFQKKKKATVCVPAPAGLFLPVPCWYDMICVEHRQRRNKLNTGNLGYTELIGDGDAQSALRYISTARLASKLP
jgi:hypothetical protein